MNTIQRIYLVAIALIMLATNVQAGRWLTRDPLEFMERDPRPTMPEVGLDEIAPGDPQVNLYKFVSNDPVNRIDPFGLQDGFGNPANVAALEEAQAAAEGYPNVQAFRAARAAEKLAEQAAKKAAQEVQKKLLSECRRMTDKELKDLYGNKLHELKEFMKNAKQYGNQLKGDKNFDFMLDKAGTVVLKGNQSGALIPTGLPPSAFAP